MKRSMISIVCLVILVVTGCSKQIENTTYTHKELAESFQPSGCESFVSVKTVLMIDGIEDKSFSGVKRGDQLMVFKRDKNDVITLHFGNSRSSQLEIITAPLTLGGSPDYVSFSVSKDTTSNLRYKSDKMINIVVTVSGKQKDYCNEGYACFSWVLEGHTYVLDTIFTGLCEIDPANGNT